ncbi:Lysosomal acid phosphatase [Trichinella zimbabwensis]|uniref:acid phosphatase n=1 Tax=Trichinella zimbabwensis TaxID=268475 RepID=A0A0V1GYA8_9BILA|nr:Lysosomal acid phosphatase [Trichinella zimbabwensis]
MHMWTHIYLRPRITDCIMIFRCHQIYGTFLIIASTLHIEVTSCNRMTCGRETKKEKKRETRNEKRKHITNSTHKKFSRNTNCLLNWLLPEFAFFTTIFLQSDHIVDDCFSRRLSFFFTNEKNCFISYSVEILHLERTARETSSQTQQLTIINQRQQHNSSTNQMKSCETIIFTIHFAFALIQCVGSSELELIFTQVLYRHGERTPLSTYPNDPYKEDAWPNGFKQLTVEGCHQQYELGNFLRRKYSKLLSKSYKSYEIYVRSTNTSRTLASAACNLAGLYSSIQPEIIPIHTVAEEEDFLLKTGLPCPGYDSAYKKDSRKVFSKIDKANKDFFKFVAKMSGIRDASTKSIGRLVGALEREIKNNFIMPEWVFTVWWDSTVGKYRTVYDMLYEFNSVRQLTKFNSKKKARFLVGTLMRNMKSKVNNYRKESKKMNMYSAHDGTVMSLMYALGIANDINPPVASCIMFDLYKNFHTDRFYVEIQFRNDTKEPPVPLILPKCMLRLCPLEKVYKILQKVSFDHTVEGKAVKSFIKCAFRVPTDSS